MNLLLIGMRGCGKTTIGRRLADRLGWSFVDLDDLTVSSFGLSSIREAWEIHGESAWRAAESAALRETLWSDSVVVALGGGTPMIDDARGFVEDQQRGARATVVYLACHSDELAARLAAAPGDRPTLTGGDLIAELDTVHQSRIETYKRLCDLQLDVTSLTVEQCVAHLVEALK